VGSRRCQLALAAALAAAVAVTSAAAGAPFRVLIKHTPNKTTSNRTRATIDAIVIHDTEGRFIGSIRVLQRASTRGSAHFVVSRRGQVVQLVPVTDVAWHAGNAWWNLHSIGIEHEGWAGRHAYTEREYRASAQLSAYLAHRWGIPVLPDAPAPTVPVVARRQVPERSTVDFHAAVHGRALWWSGVTSRMQWRRHIRRIDFLVDGNLSYSDHTWPYSFHRTIGWDSRTVANGRHMLTVRAYGAYHYRTRRSMPIRVVNPPLRLTITGAVSGGAVDGVLGIGAYANARVDRVALYVDGKRVSRDATAPYRLTWDTRTAEEGAHTLVVYARGGQGTHRAALTVPVVVANAPTFRPALAQSWLTRPSEFGHFGRVE
jgi:hypothetical protein